LQRARCAALRCITVTLSVVASAAAAQTYSHRIVFHLNPAVTTGISSNALGLRLQAYVTDLNTLFAKNTAHRLAFDPASDIDVTTNFPPYGNWSGAGSFPEDPTFTIRALVSHSTSYSYGGLACVNQSADGIAANLMWDTIHDRASLANKDPADWDAWNYWRQVHNLAHEIAHMFGAGYGEYYSFRELTDTTGVPPLASETFGGNYWSGHTDFYTDPLIVWVPQLPITQLTNEVRFSDLTAAIINGVYRDPFQQGRLVTDLTRTKITLLDSATQKGMPHTPVKGWKVKAADDRAASLLFAEDTDANGQVEFNWPAEPSNFDGLLLLKAYPANRQPVYRWQTIYDAQIARLINKQDILNIVISSPTPMPGFKQFGTVLQITWSRDLVGYQLQRSTDLKHWQACPETASLQPADHLVSVAMTNPQCFFRLTPSL